MPVRSGDNLIADLKAGWGLRLDLKAALGRDDAVDVLRLFSRHFSFDISHTDTGNELVQGYVTSLDHLRHNSLRPLVEVGAGQIIGGFNELAAVAKPIDRPVGIAAAGMHDGECPAFPRFMERAVVVFSINRAKAFFPAEIMGAIHQLPFPLAAGESIDRSRSDPIMELRVTRAARSLSDQPSVPAGRSGITM